MSWLKKLMPARIRTEAATGRKRSVPEGLWEKCDKCGSVLYRPELEENLEVCPKCGKHRPIRARARLAAFLDPGTGTEIGAALGPVDVLKFKDQKRYSDRIKAAQKASGERDALVAMAGTLAGRPAVACAFDFAFMGGSMGSVVGERFALGAERALEIGSPMVCFSATGGARMQESLFSLMQMAKTSAALGRMRAAGLPYISVMTHPTTGGVSASLAMLGDINMAEPEALIGFAGPRVIKQTLGQDLPEGFQTSEFLLDHGMLDAVVPRKQLKSTVGQLLRHMSHRPAAEGWASA